MTWLLVALVTYAGSPTPDLKIHGGLKFQSFQECNRHRSAYEEALTKELKRVFPKVETSTIRCFDNESIDKMRKYLYGGDN
jgi:hypothetical protein